VDHDASGQTDEIEAPLVLVVEDHPINQALAVAQLEQLGYRSVVTPSGWHALKEIKSQRFDMVLVDWQLSDINGLETTRRIREREKSLDAHGLPIVAVTANTMPGDRQRCIDAGMDDFHSKPISLADLRGALERALSHQRPNRRIDGTPHGQAIRKESGAIGRLIDDLGDVLGKRVVLIPKIGIYLALLRQPSVLASLFAGIVTTGLLMRRP
jgi:CheY-like chemotaxis protein